MANSGIHSDNYLKWFDRHGKARPSHDPHGTEDDIRKNLKPLKTRNWRLEGNMLVADTDMGRLTQRIPPDYICLGDDEDGNPLLQKIKV